MKKHQRSARPVLECLEPRLLLSGVVNTALSYGNLVITGDAAGQDMSIAKAANTVTITANGGETFTGKGAVIAGVTGKITLKMGASNDAVAIGGAAIFYVGNDVAASGNKDLVVDLGAGDDTLVLTTGRAGNVTITCGDGDNNVIINDNGTAPMHSSATLVFANLNITGGRSHDIVSLQGVQVKKNCTIQWRQWPE
jgi:hypothetical protein